MGKCATRGIKPNYNGGTPYPVCKNRHATSYNSINGKGLKAQISRGGETIGCGEMERVAAWYYPPPIKGMTRPYNFIGIYFTGSTGVNNSHTGRGSIISDFRFIGMNITLYPISSNCRWGRVHRNITEKKLASRWALHVKPWIQRTLEAPISVK